MTKEMIKQRLETGYCTGKITLQECVEQIETECVSNRDDMIQLEKDVKDGLYGFEHDYEYYDACAVTSSNNL
jgi:hypothetical protein